MTIKRKYKRITFPDGFKTIWHPDSTVVMKNSKTREVIGRNNDGILVKDSLVIDLCKEYKFKLFKLFKIEEEVSEEGEEENTEEENTDDNTDTNTEVNTEVSTEVSTEENVKIFKSDIDSCDKQLELYKIKCQNLINTLSSDFNDMSSDFNEKMIFHKEEITKKINMLTEKLENKNKLYEDLEEKYDKLNTKWNAIKSLLG